MPKAQSVLRRLSHPSIIKKDILIHRIYQKVKKTKYFKATPQYKEKLGKLNIDQLWELYYALDRLDNDTETPYKFHSRV